MFSKTIRPRWWLLDVIMVFVMGLLMLDARAHLSESGHQIAAVAVVLVWLVLITAWLRANASAIEQANGRSNPRMQRILPGHITVYRSNPLPENRAVAVGPAERGVPGQGSTLTELHDQPAHNGTLSAEDAATYLLVADPAPVGLPGRTV
mgnify:CR=1 FL=1